jgi:hypothetical protein
VTASGRRTARRGSAEPNGAPSSRTWRERVDDPDEPLFTVSVAADLLGIDAQALRRLGTAIEQGEARSEGNHRRYSRNDLERLSAALELAAAGHSNQSIAKILTLTAELEEARRRRR